MPEMGHTVRNPGIVIALVDQSGSMQDPWNNEGMAKSHRAAELLNQCIEDVADGSSDGSTGYRPRTFFMGFGYAGTNDDSDLLRPLLASGWVAELLQLQPEPPWVCADAFNMTDTPMARTFDMLAGVLTVMFGNHDVRQALKNSMGPTIINITDGEARDRNRHWEDNCRLTIAAADRLRSICTPSGAELLLFNAHIGEGSELLYPFEKVEGMGKMASLLFDCSSVIPEVMRAQNASSIRELAKERPHRGLIINARSANVMKLLNMGSFSAMPR